MTMRVNTVSSVSRANAQACVRFFSEITKSFFGLETMHDGDTISSSPEPKVANTSQINKAQLAIAEAMALKMQEKDRRRDEDRKRKRDEEERRDKDIKNKVLMERRKIDEEEKYVTNANRELYAMFNDLQGISHDFAIAFETPELVVVGMQSDGKSSFIEALLGFQFNIVESSILHH